MPKKRKAVFLRKRLSSFSTKKYQRLFTWLYSPDLRFAALFLCITFFFASLSSIEVTRGNNSTAVSFSVVLRNFLTALRVVLE